MDVELFTKRLVLVCVKVLHPVVMVLCYSDDMRMDCSVLLVSYIRITCQTISNPYVLVLLTDVVDVPNPQGRPPALF